MTTTTAPEGLAPACPICGGPTAPRHHDLYDDRYGRPGLFDLRRCRRCGHAFIDATFSGAELRRLYSDWYPRATQRYEELPPLAPTTGIRAWLNGERHAAHSERS